jgi:hypothetical protein
MNVVEEYRRRAVEVEKLAAAAGSEDQRQRMLEIARTWIVLADEREKMIREGRLPGSRNGPE